jgi:hypothetical protein
MRFEAIVTSIPKFPGQAIAMQLINRQEFYMLYFETSLLEPGEPMIWTDLKSILTLKPV